MLCSRRFRSSVLLVCVLRCDVIVRKVLGRQVISKLLRQWKYSTVGYSIDLEATSEYTQSALSVVSGTPTSLRRVNECSHSFCCVGGGIPGMERPCGYCSTTRAFIESKLLNTYAQMQILETLPALCSGNHCLVVDWRISASSYYLCFQGHPVHPKHSERRSVAIHECSVYCKFSIAQCNPRPDPAIYHHPQKIPV